MGYQAYVFTNKLAQFIIAWLGKLVNLANWNFLMAPPPVMFSE